MMTLPSLTNFESFAESFASFTLFISIINIYQ